MRELKDKLQYMKYTLIAGVIMSFSVILCLLYYFDFFTPLVLYIGIFILFLISLPLFIKQYLVIYNSGLSTDDKRKYYMIAFTYISLIFVYYLFAYTVITHIK